METVTNEVIDQSTEELHDLQEGELKNMVYKLSEEQPDLMSYLLTVGERQMNTEEQEVLLFLGLNIWNAFSKCKTLPFVSDAIIHEQRQINADLIEYLEKHADQGFTQIATSLIAEHNQEPLLEYVIQAIAEEEMEEEEPLVSEENRALLFSTLKAFVESIAKSDQSEAV